MDKIQKLSMMTREAQHWFSKRAKRISTVPPVVEIIGDFWSPTGYSKFTRDFARAIYEAGFEVKIVDEKHDRNTISLGPWWEWHKAILLTERVPSVSISITTPEFYRKRDCPSIGFTFWETSQLPILSPEMAQGLQLPESWAETMGRMDAIWTSSQWAVEMFKKSGVSVPVHNVPVPMEWGEAEEPEIIGLNYSQWGEYIPKEDRPFVFGVVSQWSPRKNFEDLILSFCSEFKKDEAVLVLKTYGSGHNSKREEGFIAERVYRAVEEVMVYDPPLVMAVQELYTDEEMNGLYSVFDAYVSTTRGEGWGIPIAQAMGYGVPTIATGWSAQTEYLNEFTGFPVRYTLGPVFNMNHNPWYQAPQLWANVDQQHLMNSMRSVFGMVRDECPILKDMTEHGAKIVRELSSPENVGKRVRKLIKEMIE